MPRITTVVLLTLVAWAVTGCASFPGKQEAPSLLAWAAGGKPNDKLNESTDQDTGHESPDKEEQGTTPPEQSPIKTDRPTFTPSSTTVGKDHIQLEMGYSFTHDRLTGQTVDAHSYPEANLRFGLFADWLEGRIAQNVMTLNTDSQGSHNSQTGAQDLLLGVKLALTKQKSCLPESALILQLSVPTGSNFLTQKEVCPGIDYIFSWDVIKNCLSVSGSFQANRALDPSLHFYLQLGQSLMVGSSPTKKLDAFAEWFALYPAGAIAPATGPTHNFDSGFTYKVTSNCQLDARVGVGLNHHANDYFTGGGLSIRY